MSNLGPFVGVYSRCIFGLLRSEARALDRVGFSLRKHLSELSRRVQYFSPVLGAEPYFYVLLEQGTALLSFPRCLCSSGQAGWVDRDHMSHVLPSGGPFTVGGGAS